MLTPSKPLTLTPPSLSPPSLYLPLLPRILSTTTLFLLLQTYNTLNTLALQSYYAATVLACQSYYASWYTTVLLVKQAFVLVKYGAWAVKEGIKRVWRGSEGLRRKLWFELGVFILGNGNGIFLILFWPGWIVVGGLVLGGKFVWG
ncbi:hypothetical protein HYFRA_00004965 [Hymenoscyphus fraxineus]|uniref:Uncharacterized protein n=1 Tax=Hymenoscyphus fraxineus TaxID=746836 RepID=A0A9N9PEN2_9HELO|nr:hypothetical protein HYFRA_00004965 [Hymenoscyphus fraxineus]